MAKNSWKEKIIALRLAEPGMTYQEIADRLGCKYGTVSGTCHKVDLQCGRKAPENFSETLKLGYAARRAGLTVQQIEGMADARHA